MRWWARFVVTLILAPLLWWLAYAYIANQQGTSWSDLSHQAGAVLPGIYLSFTLPALLVCAVLALVDRGLRRLGIALLGVAVAPVLAGLIAHVVTTSVGATPAGGGALPLAVTYGLVWGLTLREPRRADEDRSGAKA